MTRLLWLADELRAWGLDVVEVTGWRDRARPGAFDPVGVLIHHTAAPGPKDAPSLQVHQPMPRVGRELAKGDLFTPSRALRQSMADEGDTLRLARMPVLPGVVR